MNKRAVVAIYIDPDFYPPTINAVINIAERFQQVVVISRNNSTADYPFPANVKLVKIGRKMPVREMEKEPVYRKIWGFLKFTLTILKYSANKKTGLLLLYDPIALYGYYIFRHFNVCKKIWYHNHDMPDKKQIKKYSVGGMAAYREAAAMKHIAFFSLPSKERLQYYPGVPAAIKTFIIPNYPSLKVYKRYKGRAAGHKQVINIIYQGFIGRGLAIEEMLPLLKENINGVSLRLVLKGSVADDYKQTIGQLAADSGVAEKISWMGIGPYSELQAVTTNCDIGLGINMKTDMVSLAQGTASNKIYEYAACGLPVIIYDSEQFRKYLQEYNWVKFTSGTTRSLQQVITEILELYDGLSHAARKSFEEKLNFEKVFQPALDKVMESIANG